MPSPVDMHIYDAIHTGKPASRSTIGTNTTESPATGNTHER